MDGVIDSIANVLENIYTFAGAASKAQKIAIGMFCGVMVIIVGIVVYVIITSM